MRDRTRPAGGFEFKAAALSVIVIFLFFAPPSRAQDVIGYVLALQGHWRVTGNPGRPLAKGAAVRAGEAVQAASFAPDDYIVIAGSGVAAPAVRLRCSDPGGGCGHPLSLAALTPQAPARASGVLDAIMSLWRKAEPEAYAVLSSRGGGVRLHEAVIAIAAGKADLRPVLDSLAPGRYLLRLRPVHEKDQEGFGVAEDEVQVQPSGAPVWMSGLPAGLCTVEVKALGRADSGLAETAWLLLAPDGSYGELSGRFSEVLALTQSWGDKVDTEIVRELLRATLDHLSASSPAGAKARG